MSDSRPAHPLEQLAAYRELTPAERAIVSLRYGAELDAREIGAAVGLQPAAVRKSLERARARLGARIEALLGLGERTS